MSKTYEIYDIQSGAVVAVQTWDDQFSPTIGAGQAARVISSAALASGSFSGTGNGASVLMSGLFNVAVSGTFSATLLLERSFDAGVTWVPVAFPDGTRLSFSNAASAAWSEAELGVLYRMRCSSYTSGTAAWRISR